MGAEPLQDKDIICLGHLKRVFKLLDKLHDVGTERDTAGNRQLFFDGYVKLVMLYTWNPLLESIASLQQAVGLPKVAKALGVGRFSKGSFSEAPSVFDPELLKPIIEELAGQLPDLSLVPKALGDLPHLLTLVDGTVLTAITRLARASCGAGEDGVPATRYNTSRDGKAVHGWRLHTQFDLKTFSPHRIDRTGARNAGASRESNMLRAHLEPGRCYVGDGGYADRTLYDEISDKGSSYCIRAAENAVYEVIEERELSKAALDAGVVRDALVKVEGAKHPIRRVEVQVQPHPRRTRKGTKDVDLIALHTNLDPAAGCAVPLGAELIALIYLCRYTVELFFRTFKQTLGMRHLLSQREKGIDIQIHCTVITCLMIQLMTGKKPDKATRNIVGWYLLGIASEQDVINHLNKPDNRGVKTRAKEELWKKLGF